MISYPAIILIVLAGFVANHDATHYAHSLMPFILLASAGLVWMIDWDVDKRSH